MKLTFERLKELLIYDPVTGVFTWRKRTNNNMRPDRRAGTFCERKKDGCRTVRERRLSIDGVTYLESRVAWLYMTGRLPAHEIDHKNLCPDENYWTNLREADRTQQTVNRRAKLRNKTGIKGVQFVNGHYCARAVVNGKFKWLGNFDTPEEASKAYMNAMKEAHGEFANAG